ncbi:MAG: MBOAT family protein [Pseudomonadota bacterium]
MLFSSLLFIFGFLPATLVLVYLARRAFGGYAAMSVLFVASLIFYGWNTPIYVGLILFSIGVNFWCGRAVAHTGSRRAFAGGVVFNLGLLGWFKYIGLFSQTLSDIARADITIDGVILPLAISFFTFQQIAFLADCLKERKNPYGLLEYGLFVAFFPQLIAGPIVHHKDVMPQFSAPRFARFYRDDVLTGLILFSIGLSKKVLIADGLAPLADVVFDSANEGVSLLMVEAWLGLFAYSFQIYFDFSGYSDMALGLAAFFGIRLPMNFNSPYKSRSIVEFWRRWHISLSTFLRDYLYFPLGGNRKGVILRYRNLFIVMLLGGLWHGAAWTFVVWGGLHGAYLCVNHAFDRFNASRPPMNGPLAVTVTFIFVSFAWIFFRAETFSAAFAVIAGLSGVAPTPESIMTGPLLYSVMLLPVAAAIVWTAPNALEILDRFSSLRPQRPVFWPASGGSAALAHERVAVALLGAGAAAAIFILSASGPYEFIYFQF